MFVSLLAAQEIAKEVDPAKFFIPDEDQDGGASGSKDPNRKPPLFYMRPINIPDALPGNNSKGKGKSSAPKKLPPPKKDSPLEDDCDFDEVYEPMPFKRARLGLPRYACTLIYKNRVLFNKFPSR